MNVDIIICRIKVTFLKSYIKLYLIYIMYYTYIVYRNENSISCFLVFLSISCFLDFDFNMGGFRTNRE